MFRFGIENLRRLKSVGPVDIRPITLLVGRNSSGKSTFLRTFPLIRQSLVTRTSAPILWYGDFVDFGNFDNIVSDNDVSKSIKFSFGIDSVFSGHRLWFANAKPDDPNQSTGAIDVEISISKFEDMVRISRIKLNFREKNHCLDLFANKFGEIEKIILDGNEVSLSDKYKLHIEKDTLFPDVTIKIPGEIDSENSFFYRHHVLMMNLIDLISDKLAKYKSEGQRIGALVELFELPEMTPDVVSSMMSEGSGVSKQLGKILLDSNRSPNPQLWNDTKQLFILNRLFNYMGSAFEDLKTHLSSTLYIGPVRARSERYYRYQDLAVSEIDADGKNFPMFLNSLTKEQRDDFSRWVMKRFGYGVEVTPEAGHISINLRNGKYRTNIVDNGYGISQILPVLGQIWWASRKRAKAYGPPWVRQNRSNILLIEQPELHLHPAHQALLADAIVGEGRSSSKHGGVDFIIETHSEALVNRIGELVAEGRVAANDVQILIFETDSDDERETNVRIADFDASGVLNNWPYGFFQPAV